MKIHVNHCLMPSSGAARFEAEAGDIILLDNGKHSYGEARILSVISSDVVVVSMLDGTQEKRAIPKSKIYALMLGDRVGVT